MDWRNEMPSLVDFDRAANGEGRHRTRVRTFSSCDHVACERAFEEAREHARVSIPFYETDDAGAVAGAYRYPAETAQWAVYVEPGTLDVIVSVGRAACNRRVACAYHGGERSYRKAFRELAPVA